MTLLCTHVMLDYYHFLQSHFQGTTLDLFTDLSTYNRTLNQLILARSLNVPLNQYLKIQGTTHLLNLGAPNLMKTTQFSIRTRSLLNNRSLNQKFHTKRKLTRKWSPYWMMKIIFRVPKVQMRQ